jgi:hypothetical protein
MNTNKCQTKFIFKKSEWFEMVDNFKYKIHSVKVFEREEDIPEYLHVTFSILDEFHTGGMKTNVAVAAFVTSNARIKLYNEIYKLGDRLLYCDTDSMIFVSKPGDYMPKIGQNLGDLSSEIDSSKGKFIKVFVSAGPKNYAYKTDIDLVYCCVKGFTLNHLTSLVINFDSIKDIVCNNHSKKLIGKQLSFIRDKEFNIKTEIVDKLYSFVYDKRILHQDLTTIPYGYLL